MLVANSLQVNVYINHKSLNLVKLHVQLLSFGVKFNEILIVTDLQPRNTNCNNVIYNYYENYIDLILKSNFQLYTELS